jgi:hypothetical protein
LGVSLWNNQLALVGCSVAAVSLAWSLTQVYFNHTLRPNFARACLGVATTFCIAAVIGFPAIIDILTKRLGQTGIAGQPSLSRIVSEIYHSLPAIEPVPYLWAVVLVAACVGAMWLWAQHGAVVFPLIALGIFSFVFAFLLRQRHHFFAPKYLMPLLPVVWLGLATFLLKPRLLAVASAGLLSALLVFHALYCAGLTTAWKTKYEFVVSQEIGNLRGRIAPGDRVAFAPWSSFVFGHYYRMAVDMDLQNQLSHEERVLAPKVMELRSSPSATWLVAARLKSNKHVDRAKKYLYKLAGAYGVTVNAKDVRKHFKKRHFVVARVSAKGIEYSSLGLRDVRKFKQTVLWHR